MNVTNPKVSVIMPVHNAETFLKQSVGSVLNQSYNDLEIVCFNDASTDGSLKILEELSSNDRRVRIIDSKVNIGPGGGRNRAIRAAVGRYIMFLDADDELKKDAVKKCIEAAEANAAEIVFFDYCRFRSGSDDEETVCQLGDDASILKNDDLRKRILKRTASHCTAMYAKSVITENDLFYPEGVFYEDNAIGLATQCIARNPIKLNEVLYRYRFDNQSITRGTNEMRFFDRINSAIILLNHMKRLGLYERFRELIDFQFINLYLVHTVYGAIYRFDKVQTDKIKQVKEDIKNYIPDFRSNIYYQQQPLRAKLKLETHMRWPHLIKMLSNINRKIKRKQF